MTPPSVLAADAGFVPQIVLALYMVMLVAIAIIGYLRSKTSEEDYYLAGRGQGVLVTALTIMATFFSSAAMLGIPGLVYRDGVGFLFFALNLPVSGAAIFILGSRIWRLGRARGYVTPADMVADYYGGSSAVRLLVALAGFLYVIPYIVMQIKAGGYLAKSLFPDADTLMLFGMELDVFAIGTQVMSILTMVYVLVGGMRSVAWTDVIQGLLLLFGMLLAGIATVVAMGGVFDALGSLGDLPAAALSLPGPSGAWGPWKLLTLVMFASLATMVQPGQWMRYYAASSTKTLKSSAVIFATVLPFCFLFGVMLVALCGRLLFPPEVIDGAVVAHPDVGAIDQIVVVMVQEHVPALLGAGIGVIVVSVILVAVMAASMSTADSNLHALSAVLTRDVYDRFLRPGAGEKERAWVGRGIIVVATLLSLWIVGLGSNGSGGGGDANPAAEVLGLIGAMMLMAIAFSCQVLPLALDMLFIRRGTTAGAIAGISVGLLTVLLFTPFPGMLLGTGVGTTLADMTGPLKRTFDVGFIGFAVNAAVFAGVSCFTRRLDADHVESFRAGMMKEPD